MNKLKIGIVEDEVLIAENITMHLEDMGHRVLGVAGRFEEVITQIKVEIPDFFIVDIRLKGERSGLDVANELYSNHNIPFLFLTSSTDKNTIKQAMEMAPLGYITKPFTFDDLFIALELVKIRIQHRNSKNRQVEIRNGGQLEWIMLNQILYLEAARSYVTIFLKERNIVLRQPMNALIDLFEENEMIRIHRSYAINPESVESISKTKAIISGIKIPIGPKYRDRLLDKMRTLQS